jgi:hypothetical protein
MAGRFDTDPSFSAYGELGLGHGFTAGLELDWGTSSEMGTVFARYTLTAPSAAVQFAIDGGLGRSVDGQGTKPSVPPRGVAWQQFRNRADGALAVALLPGGGWLAVDGAAFFLDDDGRCRSGGRRRRWAST